LSRYGSLNIDSFGIVLIEAMACGCPVIRSDLPGPSSIVNKDCGIIVPKGNVEILRQAIIYMLKNSKNMREKARKYIENNYS
jgi:glycosyltransferase involved in cell wall biosynthesis